MRKTGLTGWGWRCSRWELYSPEASALKGFPKHQVRGQLASSVQDPAWAAPSLSRPAREAWVWAGSGREPCTGWTLPPGAGPRVRGGA